MDKASRGNLRKYTSANPLKRFFISRFHRQLRDMAAGLDPVRILDAGCGEGFTLRMLSQTFPEAALCGTDIRPDALADAALMVPAAELHEASIYELPYPDRHFDLVLCNEVLEHLTDPQTALRELARVCSGAALISVPYEPWFRLSNLAVLSHALTLGNPPDHINHWRPLSFAALVGPSFKIEQGAFPFPWMLFHCKPRR